MLFIAQIETAAEYINKLTENLAIKILISFIVLIVLGIIGFFKFILPWFERVVLPRIEKAFEGLGGKIDRLQDTVIDQHEATREDYNRQNEKKLEAQERQTRVLVSLCNKFGAIEEEKILLGESENGNAPAKFKVA